MTELEIPLVDSEWVHSIHGSTYKVYAITNQTATKSTFPITVVYEDSRGNIWSRPLSDWHRAFIKKETK